MGRFRCRFAEPAAQPPAETAALQKHSNMPSNKHLPKNPKACTIKSTLSTHTLWNTFGNSTMPPDVMSAAVTWKAKRKRVISATIWLLFSPQFQCPSVCGEERTSILLSHFGNTAMLQIKWITRHQRVSCKSLCVPAFRFISSIIRKH